MFTQLRCEVCGRKIYGKSIRVIIERAKLTVCSECSNHGKIIKEEKLKQKLGIRKSIKVPLRTQKIRALKSKVNTAQELVENFAWKIKQARERFSLSQEELANKMNEKASIIKKIEAGKIVPNNMIVAKLEHILRIKLLFPIKDEKLLPAYLTEPVSRALTFGDLVQMNKKIKDKKERLSGRKQS